MDICGCRLSLAEAMVKQASKWIQLPIKDHDDLKYDEFKVLLSQAEYSLNSRPLGIEGLGGNGGDDDYTLITP